MNRSKSDRGRRGRRQSQPPGSLKAPSPRRLSVDRLSYEAPKLLAAIGLSAADLHRSPHPSNSLTPPPDARSARQPDRDARRADERSFQTNARARKRAP